MRYSMRVRDRFSPEELEQERALPSQIGSSIAGYMADSDRDRQEQNQAITAGGQELPDDGSSPAARLWGGVKRVFGGGNAPAPAAPQTDATPGGGGNIYADPFGDSPAPGAAGLPTFRTEGGTPLPFDRFAPAKNPALGAGGAPALAAPMPAAPPTPAASPAPAAPAGGGQPPLTSVAQGLRPQIIEAGGKRFQMDPTYAGKVKEAERGQQIDADAARLAPTYGPEKAKLYAAFPELNPDRFSPNRALTFEQRQLLDTAKAKVELQIAGMEQSGRYSTQQLDAARIKLMGDELQQRANEARAKGYEEDAQAIEREIPTIGSTPWLIAGSDPRAASAIGALTDAATAKRDSARAIRDGTGAPPAGAPTPPSGAKVVTAAMWQRYLRGDATHHPLTPAEIRAIAKQNGYTIAPGVGN